MKCAKYVVVPHKRKSGGSHFDYDAYFKSIDAKLIGWNKDKGALLVELRRRMSKWYYANHYPGREAKKAKWVKEHYGKKK